MCSLTRQDLFFCREYDKKGYDLGCVSRVANRLFSDYAWKNHITGAFLMSVLSDRLGFKQDFRPTEEAKIRLSAVIYGLYKGARESQEEIKIDN